MSTLGLVFAVSAGSVGFLFSVVSLALHWAKRDEHPDVSRLDAAVTHIRTEIADLTDRFEHWGKRERVRRLRAGRESADDAAAANPAAGSDHQATSPADVKRALRARVYGGRFAAAGRGPNAGG